MPDSVRFDHYEVLTRDDGSLYELGRGAMGVTYKALDTNLRIPVALKVIGTAHLHSEIARQRFIREARSAARLRNPHVAAVYHLGLEGDTWFYAMEFIDGETVDALLKRNGPLPSKLALEITDQVARALQAAEPHGLVHRDIKPANLMVIRDGDQLVVKVIDFGLAKSSLPEDESATLSMGGFVGTPHFASPEQLEEKDLDVRSDIYSVGVTLWFMLAGKTPFAGSMAQVMSAHLSKTPPFEKLNVPAPLARLLRRLLEKRPVDRPQNATELRREVAKCIAELDAAGVGHLASEPVTARDAQESFLTMVDPALAGEGAGHFEPGIVVAARYRVAEAVGDSNLGRVFRAHDQTRARDVKLVVLHDSIALSTEALSALERMVEALAPRPHDHVVQIEAIETVGQSTFLVLEWTEGSSLVEVLRARRELDSAEVIALLAPAASGVDHILACGLDETDLALHQVLVAFSSKPEDGWIRQPAGTWPAHSIKINPLSSRGAVAAGETWAGGQTLVDAPKPTSPGGAAAKAVRALGAIAYELLGGKLSPAALALGGIEFKPLAALSEAGNEILRRALGSEPPFASAHALVAALAEPEAAELPRREQLTTSAQTRVRPREVDASTAAQPPEAAVPAKKKAPWAIIIVALLALAGGAAWYLTRPAPGTLGAEPTPGGGTAAIEAGDPAASPTSGLKIDVSGVPVTPSRKDMLASAIAAAKDHEAKQAWPEALAEWTKIAKEFPESDAGRANLESICYTMRSRPDGLDVEVFAALRAPLTDAAQIGVISAMMVLGENLRKMVPEESFQWFNRAGEAGDPEGMVQAGLLYSNGLGVEKDLAKAVELFTKAAEKGHVSAKVTLGECLLFGKGIEKDEKAAIALFEEAAAAMHPRAFDLMGTVYNDGLGRTKDKAQALKYFLRAADLGISRAYANVGVLYMAVEKDNRKAFDAFRKGAEAKDPRAMFFLAQCYREGFGTGKNLQQARHWFEQAAAAGSKDAADWLAANPAVPE
jgi:serine/threonine protein kinase/TPR repeat protein